MLAALATFGFDTVVTGTYTPGDPEAEPMVVTGPVTVADARHGDEDSGHDHESFECSPCPSCFGALPYAPALDSEGVTMVRALNLLWNYDDVVPGGIRRPPRLA